MTAPRRYVYGPVASRRLGSSLGIDPIPLKVCNWNCVYCQLGRTRPVTNARRVYHDPAAILAELRAVLAQRGGDGLDWITVVGSGEPTLNTALGTVLRGIRELSDKPLAVITNGALLWLPEVRRDLALADAVLPSLDAGSAALYRKINRGHPEVTFERLVAGLCAFRREFAGALWVETMLVGGLNDTAAALHDLAAVVRQVRPDRVHLNTPTRPPAEPWVAPTDAEGLMRAQAILGDVARAVGPVGLRLELDRNGGGLDALLEVIARHPIATDELRQLLQAEHPDAAARLLAALADSPDARCVERHGHRFWVASRTIFPERSNPPHHSAPQPAGG